MVFSKDQELLKDWLCSRILLKPTENIQCLGSVVGGRIRGVVGFDTYNGASIQIHSAGDPGWVTREMLWATFDYPFNVCKVNVLVGVVASNNKAAIRFNEHLGFKVEHILEGAHPDGDLVTMTMRPGECRYLNRGRHGQVIRFFPSGPGLRRVGEATSGPESASG